MRPSLVTALVAALALAAEAPVAAAQDWDVGPARPSRPTRPSRPARPSRPSRPVAPARPSRPVLPARPQPPSTPVTPPAPAPGAEAARTQRMIEHLTAVLLRGDDDNAVALPTLVRLVRERDGSLEALTADLTRRASAEGPEAAAATRALGHLARDSGRLDEALARYRRAAELAPASPAAHLAAAETLRRMNRHADAAASYERALGMNLPAARQPEVLRALVDLGLAQGDVASARAWHQRLVARSPGSLSVRRELADALLTRRMYAEAVEELRGLSRALAGDNRVLSPVLRDLGRAQMEAGQLDEALASLRRALSLAGADAGVRRQALDDMTELRTRRNELDAWVRELEQQGGASWERLMLLGRLHAEQGRAEQAIAAYRRASAARPGDLDALVRLVQLLAQQARLDELLAVRRRLVAAAPRNPAFVLELVDELVRSGRRAEALQVMARASAAAGPDADVHQRLAAAYARLGEQGLALRETELVARYDPSDPTALEALGERLLEQGQRERALATWRRIVENARDRGRGLAALAEVYGRHDMPAEAVGLYREALALRPDDVEIHKNLAVLEESSRAFEPAIVAWRRVIELARNDRELRREARARIVNLWNLTGRLPAQIPALERAFAATPPDLEAGRDLAECLARLRRHDEADRVLARLTSLDPADVASLVSLERLRAQRGDLAGALEVARRLVEADPRHAREWHQRMAAHALALHRDAEAIASAARAVELNPDDGAAHLRLGELYRARGDATQAAAAFRRALALDDRQWPTHFLLADLHLARGEAREAVELYRRVVRLSPDDDLVARAGRMAIQVAPAADALPDLERDLASAYASAPTRAVLRRLLVDLYAATCRPLVHALRHGSDQDAARARAALTRTGARALKPLLDALSDNDDARRRTALELLGHLGNPNAAAALLTVAGSDAPHAVRVEALRAAASVADARALPRLVTLARGGDVTLATLAAWGLGRVRSPAAVAALTGLVARREHPEVAAMAALSLTGVRAARPTLLAALDARQELWLPAAAAVALAPTADAVVLARLRAMLVAGDWSRAAALAAIGHLPPALRERAVDDLAAALFSPVVVRQATGDLLVRRIAARSLARAASRDVTALGRALDDPDGAASVARLLGRVLDPADAPVDGADALARYAPAVARAARDALTTPAGVAAVLDALAAPDRVAPLTTRATPASNEAVAAARGLLAALAEPLAELASHPDLTVRRAVLRVLARSDAPAAASALARAASDADPGLSGLALTLLAEREGVVTAGLARHLDTASPWELRLRAAEALGRSEASDAVEALSRALASDPLSIVRSACARALARRAADPSARAALERASRDDVDLGVREAAGEALR